MSLTFEVSRRPDVPAHIIAQGPLEGLALAYPTIWHFPMVRDDGSIGVDSVARYPEPAGSAVQALKAALADRSGVIPVDLVFGTAVALLTLANDLTPGAACQLLVLDQGGAEQLLNEVATAVAGMRIQTIAGDDDDQVETSSSSS